MDEEIWHKPMQPPAVIIERVENELKDIALGAEDIELHIKLSGRGAARYAFISKILEIGFGETAENTAQYLLRKGVEAEISRLIGSMDHTSNDKS